MKIKSFKGRRLLLEMTVEQVAEKLGYSENPIKDIERLEPIIKELNEFYEKMEAEEIDTGT